MSDTSRAIEDAAELVRMDRVPLRMAVQMFEDAYIDATLRATTGGGRYRPNVAHAARLMKIHRNTLIVKLAKRQGR